MANQVTIKDQAYNIGDMIRVHQTIKEDNKTRTQIFEGLLIAIKGRGDNKTFTVRKIGANAIGVERIFPVMSPNIKQVELKNKGHVRRSKLYYMRDRIGRKALRVKTKKASQK